MDNSAVPFTVVCIYNNEEILNDYLAKGLAIQDFPHQDIFIDNTKGRFTSAAQAFNSVIPNIQGEFAVFSHQDILFTSEDTLRQAYKMLKANKNLCVAGVAGVRDRTGIKTNIQHGSPPCNAGLQRLKAVERVQSVDECLFIVPKVLLLYLPFDEETCRGWHLYSVDYCLSAGKFADVVVLPLDLYHRSKGTLSDDYYKTLRKVTRKHSDHYKTIFTTTGIWPTGSWKLRLKFFKDSIIKRLKQWIAYYILKP